ncbi:c-type cytochrome [Aliiruegeria lutimaris]|uniref:WD-40 repeat-containing protein n=1 Tax=Aliiruegeria lutimaris TaxID=571298 RepID=A0A1G9D0E4_9RHOB|nr:c-type cytochrome [Aliiruegeria lutimaris]SDK57386.1 WD-40 repeat-containing protein [Aliiruegeria lutimaris]
MLRAALIAGLSLAPPLAGAGEFFTLEGHGGPVKGIAAGPQGEILTASFDNSVGLWRGGEPLWLEGHAAAVNTVAFVDSNRAVSAGDDFALFLWNLETGQGQRLGSHKGKVMSLAVSPGGQTIASASWDGSIGIWDLEDPGVEARFFTGHDAGVNAVAFSEDGETLYSGSADGTLRLWRVADGTALGQLANNGFGINTLVLNETAGWIAYGGVDGATKALSLSDGSVIADLTLDRRPILGMAPGPGKRLLAVGDGEGYISLIDTETWRFTLDFRATLRGPVWALAFSPDGGNVHAGGLDDAMFSWPVEGAGERPQMVEGERSFLASGDDVSNGERQFQRKCSICHTLGPGENRRAGPSLHALFGRRAGTVPGYSYSETLEDSEIVWGPETIDALFDLGPEVYVAGTKMPMQRIVKAQDRADLVDFLREATRGE